MIAAVVAPDAAGRIATMALFREKGESIHAILARSRRAIAGAAQAVQFVDWDSPSDGWA